MRGILCTPLAWHPDGSKRKVCEVRRDGRWLGTLELSAAPAPWHAVRADGRELTFRRRSEALAWLAGRR